MHSGNEKKSSTMGEVDIIPLLVSKIFPYYKFAIFLETLSLKKNIKKNSILSHQNQNQNPNAFLPLTFGLRRR